MSADNTIVILETESGFRVAEVRAAENLDCPNSKYIDAYFADKKMFYREQEAWQEAQSLYDEITAPGGYVEYGIRKVKIDSTKLAPQVPIRSQFNDDGDEFYYQDLNG